MGYQLQRPITKKRPPYKQTLSIGTSFANRIYDFFANFKTSNPIARPLHTSHNQLQEHNQTQQAPKAYKPLMVFTGTDPENLVDVYLNAVTAM